MKTTQRLAAFPALLSTLFLFSFAGCENAVPPVSDAADASPPAAPPAETPVATKSTNETQPTNTEHAGVSVGFKEVFNAWDSGAKDKAIEHLAAVDWNSPAVQKGIPALEISESEFSSLTNANRNELQADALQLTSQAKQIMRHAFQLAEEAQAAGDLARAKRYCQSVAQLGTALAKDDKLKVLQMVGQALQNAAAEKIASFD